ncbi:MAG: Gfo/Idh/MocA family oxidoreductase, partial [Desulfatiglandales bacterium]|nr:Gfo/Idh/MocA family oxidoreductase [Desulfatiglandales bacterium]
MDNHIKVAVIGADYWGKDLIRNFDSLGVLGAICDNRKKPLEEFGRTYPHAYTTDSFQSILDDPAIEALAIASPAEMHYQMVKAGLLAGKHTFVEKPLALCEEEGMEVAALAGDKKKVL